MNIPNPKLILTKISEMTEIPSLGIYTRDSSEDHKVTYLRHPNLSTEDRSSLPSPMASLAILR
jgi:hypothetical protein